MMDKPTLTKMKTDNPFKFQPINCYDCSKHGREEGITLWDSGQHSHTYCKACCLDVLDGLNMAKIEKKHG